METRYVGSRVQRLEDPRLVTGTGHFVDDIRIDGTLQAAFLRSPHAHARITRIDTEAARAMPGVVAVYTLADLPGVSGPIPIRSDAPADAQIRAPYPLAHDAVHYVGETVAMVVAQTRSAAEDATAAIEVDYDPLPAVTELASALDPASPKAHEDIATNLVTRLKARFGDPEQVFSSAAHVFKDTFVMHRGGCHSMETRGVLAHPTAEGRLEVWSSTQHPFALQRGLAKYLKREAPSIRVTAPDVGGGFGPKASYYPEEFAVAAAAVALGRPVKWIEDRREHFVATCQQRDQIWTVEVAADRNGRMLAVRGRCLHDNGAYIPSGLTVPQSSMRTFPGPYALAALDVTCDVVFTNMVPVVPVRGSARPNVCFVLERLADRIAHELGLSPAEVRRRSFIAKEQFPYDTGLKGRDPGSSTVYDSGDYHACLDTALASFTDFAARQAAARKAGRYIGLGIASYVEDTGRPLEGATVKVESSGRVSVTTGAGAQGQGLKTILAQITADALGVGLDAIDVVTADTDRFPDGQGTVGSRTAVTAGSSTHIAALELKEKLLRAAAGVLGSGNRFLELRDGRVQIADEPAVSITLADLMARLAGPDAAQLAATAEHNAGAQPFSFGTNACEVEVDIDTGEVKILRYVVAHDCGRVIHPGMVDGQIRGGVVHGIGNALFERMSYDESGNPVTTNYGEYLLPMAMEMPRIEIHHLETLSPLNPLGIKGAGEGGTIPAAACIIAAMENALAPFGVHLTQHPVSPQRLLDMIAAGQARAA